MAKAILVTGGCGFVGSHIAINLKEIYPDYNVIAFDNLRRRGSELNLTRLKEAGVSFIHGDLRKKEDLDQVGEVFLIIDAAAEPSVLSGLDGSVDYVIETNLIGTINCLNYAKKYNSDFIFLSTSRVYPIEEINKIKFHEDATRFIVSDKQLINGVSGKGISEDFPLSGARSLYGACKLSSELFIREYGAFFGIRFIINRCGVITGPWQMGKEDQGVIVLWAASHYWKRKLKYIGYGGTGKQVRDILHISDLFSLLKYQVENIDVLNGEIFNVGGGTESSVSLLELTELCRAATDTLIEIEPVTEIRKADVPIYITDNTKVSKVTGWRPKVKPEQIINEIAGWIRENEKSLQYILK